MSSLLRGHLKPVWFYGPSHQIVLGHGPCCLRSTDLTCCAWVWVQLPYIGFIWQIMRSNSAHPMLLLEVPHVSVRLNSVRATFVDSVAHTAACILWRHGYEDACFLAHSYGTFCVSRMCQIYRPMVHSLVSLFPPHPVSANYLLLRGVAQPID